MTGNRHNMPGAAEAADDAASKRPTTLTESRASESPPGRALHRPPPHRRISTPRTSPIGAAPGLRLGTRTPPPARNGVPCGSIAPAVRPSGGLARRLASVARRRGGLRCATDRAGHAPATHPVPGTPLPVLGTAAPLFAPLFAAKAHAVELVGNIPGSPTKEGSSMTVFSGRGRECGRFLLRGFGILLGGRHDMPDGWWDGLRDSLRDSMARPCCEVVGSAPRCRTGGIHGTGEGRQGAFRTQRAPCCQAVQCLCPAARRGFGGFPPGDYPPPHANAPTAVFAGGRGQTRAVVARGRFVPPFGLCDRFCRNPCLAGCADRAVHAPGAASR